MLDKPDSICYYAYAVLTKDSRYAVKTVIKAHSAACRGENAKVKPVLIQDAYFHALFIALSARRAERAIFK